MSSTTIQATELPTGTYGADKVHSSVAFEVQYMGIGNFGGTVSDFDASLVDGRLSGAARIATLEVKDENLHGHLMSPEFFDAAQYPEVSFSTEQAQIEGSSVRFEGEITIKGVTQPAVLTGTIVGPTTDPVRQRALRPRPRDHRRSHRLRDHLEQRHAERHQGPVRRGHPQGEPLTGEGSVTMRILAISGSLRRDSHNTSLLQAARELLGPGDTLELWEGLREVPPYDQDDDVEPAPAAVAGLRAAVASADAVLIATPEFNHSIPGTLKNALDWASRPFATNAFRDKPVAVIGSSTGLFGAVWAQAELRKVLTAMGARVVDVEIAVGLAAEKFDASGQLLDEQVREQLRDAVAALAAETAARAHRGLVFALGKRRRIVFGEPPLHRRAREHADELPVVDDRDPLEVLFLEEREGLGERHVGVDRRVRRLGDLAHGGRPRIEPARDDLADERLARDHADEVAAVADEHGAHLGPHQRLARLLRGRRGLEGMRRRDHRVADALLLVAAHG